MAARLVIVAAALWVGMCIAGAMPSTVLASWYDCRKPGECSAHKITASGERFNPAALTAASRTIPIGKRVRVTFRGKSVVVRINDYGPAARTGRGLDLSAGAARRIGLRQVGVARVHVEVL